jgi:hypothetical protein
MWLLNTEYKKKIIKKTIIKKLRGFGLQANYTDRATAVCSLS